uniref:Uncharacterized protein n=1 Tax=Anguilla anguilla TaxID=7936 RepID=A0A0E9WWJ3_ANGAN
MAKTETNENHSAPNLYRVCPQSSSASDSTFTVTLSTSRWPDSPRSLSMMKNPQTRRLVAC